MEPTLPDYTDLFRELAAGDTLAFRQLFHVYNARLHPFVLKITRSDAVTEDILQETFIRLWVHRSEVSGMDYPASWLYKVASNLSLTHLRCQAAEIRKLKRMVYHGNTGDQDHALENISVKEIQALLSSAIERLPPRRQHIYKLSKEQGLSHQEIADMLHISPNTVKNQLVSSFSFIRNYIRQASGMALPLLILLLLQ